VKGWTGYVLLRFVPVVDSYDHCYEVMLFTGRLK